MTQRDEIRNALVAELEQASSQTARDLTARLNHRGIRCDKAEVNSILHGDGAFRRDAAQPPRWSLSQPTAPPSPPLSHSLLRRAPVRLPRREAPEIRLYGWQEDALRAWREAGERGVIEAVTGTGKTMVGVVAALETLERHERVCVLVPTKELQRQWVKILDRYAPDARIGRLGNGHHDTLRSCDILVAIVNLARNTDLGATPGAGLLIADECHRYASEHNRKALDKRFARRLGLSATYARSDGGNADWLDPYFGGTCFLMDYPMALADEVTAHFKVALIGCRFSRQEERTYEELRRIRSKTRQLLVDRFGVPPEPFGKFIQEVNRLANTLEAGHREASRYLQAFQQCRKLLAETPAKGKALSLLSDAIRAADRTLAFTQTIDAATAAAAQLQAVGVDASAVHSGSDDAHRRKLLQQFGSGQLKVLVAPQVLDEGVDVPAADLAIIIAASHSQRQMIQRMGRVLRRKADHRLARFAVLYVERTSEDPDLGAHEDFMEEITGIADEVTVFRAGTPSETICKFLNGMAPKNPPRDPRWAGEPPRGKRSSPRTTRAATNTRQSTIPSTPADGSNDLAMLCLELSLIRRDGHDLHAVTAPNSQGDTGFRLWCSCGDFLEWHRDRVKARDAAREHVRKAIGG